MCSCVGLKAVALACCDAYLIACLFQMSAAQNDKENKTPAKKDTNKRPAEKELSPGEVKSQCVSYFKRVATGQVKKATAEDVAQAKEALDTYGGLPKCDQVAFAKSFFSAKNGKNFGFIKDYTEKVQASKQVKQSINENHFTRIAVLIVKKHMRASLSHPLTSTPPLLSQYMRFRRIYLCVCWHNSPEIHAIMA